MFENETIKLRKLTTDDANVYHSWCNDVEVMENTSLHLDMHTLEETEQFISEIASQSNAKGYMIEHKETKQTVGIVSLVNIDDKNRSAECIIDIGVKDMWNKGIGASAMALILEFAFLELNLHRIYLQVFSFNKRAIKLYEKMRFTYEGKQRQALYRKGKWHDIVMMSILEDEYF
ncbi:GNAT family N-acetyltransferase [Tetragenococcus solitarius]|uniref:GNAT family protein n=1 Tax=Tetragenococcus solitarius TaxID=71453 RepID=A0ABN3YA97_9ENTE|nr:GNAT family protein [Tetragenococcus solitarius]